MREIKYRAWGKESDYWIDNFSISNCGEFIYLEDGFERGISDVILEQFTGLRDKNGKEIYEGDILDFNYEKYPDDTQCPRVVVFEDGCFRKDYKNSDKSFPKPIITKCSLSILEDVIIGNIHENPELLEPDNA